MGHRNFVAIGGNVGSKSAIAARFGCAVDELQLLVGPVTTSRLYISPPSGPVLNQPSFLNGVLAFDTERSAEWVLGVLEELEKEFGRVEKGGQGPRTLDLDFLASGKRCLVSTGLTLPHPKAKVRDFVMVPWSELVPSDYCIPGEAETVCQLAKRMDSTLELYSEFRFAE